MNWFGIRQTDPRAVALYRRHYSAQKGNRQHGITGPGATMTLLTADGRALWVWRRVMWLGGHEWDWLQEGIYCAIFRNEGTIQSSQLVREADALGFTRWPGRIHYTWINPQAVASVNPGFCFKVAGWSREGMSKSGRHLLILKAVP